MKYIIKQAFYCIGKMVYLLLPSIVNIFSKLHICIISGYYSSCFNKVGKNLLVFSRFVRLLGPKYIEIGNNVSFLGKSILTAIEEYHEYTNGEIKCKKHTPSIVIGDNCFISEYNNITAINRIEIGNNVLTGPNVLITDNSHGTIKDILENIPPRFRPLHSKGAVIIKDNVWIAEGVKILPGVTIGEFSIIAANSVVTKDIPPYSLVVGIPAYVKKQFVCDK